jgi:hypothetical protein
MLISLGEACPWNYTQVQLSQSYQILPGKPQMFPAMQLQHLSVNLKTYTGEPIQVAGGALGEGAAWPAGGEAVSVKCQRAIIGNMRINYQHRV